MDEPLRSNSYCPFFSAILVSGLLLGCARGAPPLPEVRDQPVAPAATSNNATTSAGEVSIKCDQLDFQLTVLEREEETLNLQIKGDRGRNQMAGYFGGLFLLPLLAAKDHPEEKQRLNSIQTERDGIYEEKKRYRCP